MGISIRFWIALLLLCVRAHSAPTQFAPLSPEESLKRIRLPSSLKAEIVASEPLVEDPVAIDFDSVGRMYVVEMRGFMTDIDGTEEGKPTGRIVVLSRSKGSPIYDERKVFADGLVLPRAVAVVEGGVLVGEPPNLWFYKDANGDAIAEGRERIDDRFGEAGGNPEHQPNGLVVSPDGWIYCAKHDARYRWTKKGWIKERVAKRGQWGLSIDDFANHFFAYASAPALWEAIPLVYQKRNQSLSKGFSGAERNLLTDIRVYPGHDNPNVTDVNELAGNRLKVFTAAGGISMFLGTRLSLEYRRNLFVGDAAGNLVRRLILNKGEDAAINPYPGGEFLTSDDPNFRPVTIANGPDGALYIVDMYRGIVQHKKWVSKHLKKLAKENGLAQIVHRGRIYRIFDPNLPVHEAHAFDEGTLGDSNGWCRYHTFRLAATGANLAPPGRASKPDSTSEYRARLLALDGIQGRWSLRGLGKALETEEPNLLRLAIRFSEPFAGEGAIRKRLSQLVLHSDFRVALQALLSFPVDRSDETLALEWKALLMRPDSIEIRDAIYTRLHGREESWVKLLIAKLRERPDGNLAEFLSSVILSGLARQDLPFNQRRIDDVVELFGKAPYISFAILKAMAHFFPEKNSIPIAGKPLKLMELRKGISSNSFGRGLFDGALRRLAWEGKDLPQLGTAPNGKLAEKKKPTNGTFRERMKRDLADMEKWLEENWNLNPDFTGRKKKMGYRYKMGHEIYAANCQSCHQENGEGIAGVVPPLQNSEWVNGDAKTLIEIVRNGRTGPIQVAGEGYSGAMPAFAALSDEELAGVLTYIRASWGNRAEEIPIEAIAAAR